MTKNYCKVLMMAISVAFREVVTDQRPDSLKSSSVQSESAVLEAPKTLLLSSLLARDSSSKKLI